MLYSRETSGCFIRKEEILAYKRITVDEYEIQGDYGEGWECVDTQPTLKEAHASLKTYDENESAPHRIIKKRVKIDEG